MGQLPKTYDPSQIEARWYEAWDREGAFAPDADTAKPTYVIMIPPPNITGILHMGHVLNNTLQDILVRWRRLSGDAVLWLPGTDHAGIATQNRVKESLQEEGIDMRDLGREAFVERCWAWREQYGGAIIRQLRRLGCSLDWSRERFTMDEGLSHAVRVVFETLYEKGLIYQGDYMTNWCPTCQSALSDEEVEHQEVKGRLWHLRYPLSDGSGHMVVATTRPETMVGDQAVAVHPEDERYAHVIGKTVRLPIVEREVPIIADEYVDREFGSGAVKITPGHDPNDFELGRRHNLTVLTVMDAAGRMTSAAGPLAGMSREDARDEVVRRFEEVDLLEGTKSHVHNVGHCYRDGAVIEPIVSRQWFVKMAPLAAPAIEAVRDGRITFTPERWAKTYFHWMENIRDWCISRQLWWGHRIPVWYCEACGEAHLEKELEKCKSCGANAFQQDPDVLDTWFSSWLWPFSTLGWPEETPDLARFYPGNTLVTGPDIIFFWVARMIMAGMEFRGEIPFHDVVFNGIVRDDIGRKMSKSLGNSPDPIDIIDANGADALRFTMVYLMPKDGDVNFAEKKVETGSFFANKLWQVSRFVLMKLGDESITDAPAARSLADRWIRSRFDAVAADTTRCLERFEFSDAAHLLYDFLWHEFCDWYVEMVKVPLDPRRDVPAPARAAARATLVDVLAGTLALLHPFMPFITEEIHAQLPGERGHLAVGRWPRSGGTRDVELEARMKVLMGVVTTIRNLRSEMNVPPAKTADVTLRTPAGVAEWLADEVDLIAALTRAGSIAVGPDVEPQMPASSGVQHDVEVFVHLQGLVDVDAEMDRLRRELDKASAHYQSTFKKLSNKDFLDRAPEDVIARERERLVRLESDREKLSRSLAVLSGEPDAS